MQSRDRKLFELHKNLYHYTKSRTLIDKIIPSMSIQMGSYQNLNDPREAKTWPFTLYTRKKETNDRFQVSIFEELSDYITKKTLVLCCTEDDPDVGEKDDERDIRSGYGHPRMWAQYANGHKGVCLVFNHEALHSSLIEKVGDEGLYHGSVDYLSSVSGPDGDAYHIQYLDDILDSDLASVVEPHIKKHNKSLFFTKHIDWRDEWEYRWVLRSNDDTPILIPIENSIKGVIIGNECSPKDTKDILEACAIKKIPVYKLLQHGWSMSLIPINKGEESALSLNGITFSTMIPCAGVFVQARDNSGNIKPIHIKNSGDVVIAG